MPPSLSEIAKRRLNLITDRIHTLPMVVLMPHSRCNARCVMCDIWKANANAVELTTEDLAPHVADLAKLGVRRFVFSGGEALMHSNLFVLCELLREETGAKLTLLSTGLTLERHAEAVALHFDEVTVSLDGPQEVHDRIRNIPRAYERLAKGVAAIKAAGVRRATARCVVQRLNFRQLEATVADARAASLDEISFLPVDVSTEAFNRAGGWPSDRVSETALSLAEAYELRDLVEHLIAAHAQDRFIAEPPSKLRQIAQYFLALAGVTVFPRTRCNAPWTSAVVESDGSVRPCFFHPSFGNIHTASLRAILDGEVATRFRRNLDVSIDPVCRKCVCTLHIGAASDV